MYEHIFFKKDEKRPDGARYHRAMLVWLVLEFLYTTINGELYTLIKGQAISPDKMDETPAFQAITGKLEKTKEAYLEAVKDVPKKYNSGKKAFDDLEKKLELFQISMKDKIKTHRQLLHNAEVAEANATAREASDKRAEASELLLIETRHKLMIKELRSRFVGVAISGASWVNEQILASVAEIQSVSSDLSEAEGLAIAHRVIREEAAFASIRGMVLGGESPEMKSSVSDGLGRYGTFQPSRAEGSHAPGQQASFR